MTSRALARTREASISIVENIPISTLVKVTYKHIISTQYLFMYTRQGSGCSMLSATCEPQLESGICARGSMMMLYRGKKYHAFIKGKHDAG